MDTNEITKIMMIQIMMILLSFYAFVMLKIRGLHGNVSLICHVFVLINRYKIFSDIYAVERSQKHMLGAWEFQISVHKNLISILKVTNNRRKIK